MTDRDIKPENCPLCRRPKWTIDVLADDVCQADRFDSHMPASHSIVLADCRSRALTIAALVAPVVETVGYWLNSDDYSDGPGKFGAQVAHNYDAMRDGLRKLRSS